MDDIQYKLVRRALGLYYNRSASNVLRIYIHGILICGDNDHFECVLRAGCEPPHNGDLPTGR